MGRVRVPEQHEGKRKEILDAAHRCFLRYGLQGASISMICKEAGMSPGHLYHYFPSKDAIIEQMADEYLSTLHTYFGRQETGDVATVLLSEIWSMSSWDDTAHCRILFELLAEAGRNDRVRDILADNTAGVRKLLAQTLRAGQAKGEVDRGLLGVFQRVQLFVHGRGGAGGWPKSIKTLVRTEPAGSYPAAQFPG